MPRTRRKKKKSVSSCLAQSVRLGKCLILIYSSDRTALSLESHPYLRALHYLTLSNVQEKHSASLFFNEQEVFCPGGQSRCVPNPGLKLTAALNVPAHWPFAQPQGAWPCFGVSVPHQPCQAPRWILALKSKGKTLINI